MYMIFHVIFNLFHFWIRNFSTFYMIHVHSLLRSHIGNKSHSFQMSDFRSSCSGFAPLSRQARGGKLAGTLQAFLPSNIEQESIIHHIDTKNVFSGKGGMEGKSETGTRRLHWLRIRSGTGREDSVLAELVRIPRHGHVGTGGLDWTTLLPGKPTTTITRFCVVPAKDVVAAFRVEADWIRMIEMRWVERQRLERERERKWGPQRMIAGLCSVHFPDAFRPRPGLAMMMDGAFRFPFPHRWNELTCQYLSVMGFP